MRGTFDNASHVLTGFSNRTIASSLSAVYFYDIYPWSPFDCFLWGYLLSFLLLGLVVHCFYLANPVGLFFYVILLFSLYFATVDQYFTSAHRWFSWLSIGLLCGKS